MLQALDHFGEHEVAVQNRIVIAVFQDSRVQSCNSTLLHIGLKRVKRSG